MVTSYQPYSCLSIVPGFLVLPGMMISQPNADLVRQLCLSQLESRYIRVNPDSLNGIISLTAKESWSFPMPWPVD